LVVIKAQTTPWLLSRINNLYLLK